MVSRARHDGPFRLQPEEVVRGEFVSPRVVRERAAHEPFCPDGLAVLLEYQRRVAWRRGGGSPVGPRTRDGRNSLRSRTAPVGRRSSPPMPSTPTPPV